MIPQARRIPGRRLGLSTEQYARFRSQTTNAHANRMAEEELNAGGPAARRRLNAWLSGRTLSGSLVA